ncbi:hypothetical protein D3C86_1542450 [compost metagenome]
MIHQRLACPSQVSPGFLTVYFTDVPRCAEVVGSRLTVDWLRPPPSNRIQEFSRRSSKLGFESKLSEAFANERPNVPSGFGFTTCIGSRFEASASCTVVATCRSAISE